MQPGNPPSPQAPAAPLPLTCAHHPAIEPIAATWDALVPKDVPHLRSGFLKAAERGGMIQAPDYLLVSRDGRPAAAAVAYTLSVDAATLPLPGPPSWVGRIRRLVPGSLLRPHRICGSPISNGESGVYFDPQLSPDLRRPVLARIVQEVTRSSRLNHTLFFKDFGSEEVTGFANELEKLGFFSVDPGPGTRLVLRWSSFDEYMTAMRTKYRAQLRKDLKAGQDLEFSLLDSFAELAPRATALYLNVVAQAALTMQVASETFFATLSDFDQAKLLVARLRPTGEVVGINVLLFGDTCMQNVYIGFDYELNKRCRIYFNLFEYSLRLALERNCKVATFGQTSYDFKARLGANPFPLTAYMKHRLWPIHHLLRSSRDKIFPKTEEVVSHDIFHDGGGEEE
jgi:hypothetical protein